MTTTATSSLTRINPTSWSQAFGHDQAQLRHAAGEFLTIAGQGSIDAEGQLLHADDPAAQLALTLANVGALLDSAGMTAHHLAHLRVYVTDLDAVLAAWDTVVEFLGEARPPSTLVEVSRLPVPGMAVEIDALAIR